MKNLSLKSSILGMIFVMPPHSSPSNLLEVEWAWFFRVRAELKLLNIEPGWGGAIKIRSYVTWVFYAEPHWTFDCNELLLVSIWSSFCFINCQINFGPGPMSPLLLILRKSHESRFDFWNFFELVTSSPLPRKSQNGKDPLKHQIDFFEECSTRVWNFFQRCEKLVFCRA